MTPVLADAARGGRAAAPDHGKQRTDNNMMDEPVGGEAAAGEKKWHALNRIQRRVAGVLVEKAKTTPEQYPLSLNGITNGCNQKSNRAPQMNLAADDVELALDELRERGVVVEVQGSGRVAKYKHLLYDWLGVDKVEIAVMAELLLRGEQTVGELRGRAARMEPIPDLATLKPVLQGLAARGLVVELTPEGRGQIVTHGLYEPHELGQLQERHAAGPPPAAASGGTAAANLQLPPAPAATAPGVSLADFEALQAEVAELRDELARLANKLDELLG